MGSVSEWRPDILRRTVVRKVRQIGVAGALRHGIEKLLRDLRKAFVFKGLSPDPFDSRYGTDTALIVSVGALDIASNKVEHSNRYEAVAPEAFHAIMRDLPIAHEEFIFIDIGAGKGRALLLAAKFPFQQIVGVDISERLTQIALNNIRLFSDETQQCHEIRVICKDAASYELPLSKTVLYLYNPFDEHVMKTVLTNIERSLNACPRKIYVAYQQYLHRSLWDRSDYFQLIKKTDTCLLYETRSF